MKVKFKLANGERMFESRLDRALVWKNYVIRTSIVRFVSSKGIGNLSDSERKEFFRVRLLRENVVFTVVWYRKFQGIIGYLNYGYLILELSSGCSRWLDRKEESFTFVWIAGRIDGRSFLVD